jgi:preprotein translocase subunit SecE
MADRIKLVIALLLIGGGIAGFYYFSDQSLLVRVLGLLVVIGIAVGVALTSETGKSTWSFFKDARTEVRKVVWPTRKETSQTTLLIFVGVVIVGLFLWGLDSLLLWAVQSMTGQGS